MIMYKYFYLVYISFIVINAQEQQTCQLIDYKN